MNNSRTGRSQGLMILIFAAGVFLLLDRIPFGHYIQWPFIIIRTFIHEMGHGLTAILTGGDLIRIEIFRNASGLAYTQNAPGWRQAAVSAGGLLAPSIIGGLFIIAGKSRKASSLTFLMFSAFMFICCVLWVRSMFGLLILLPTSLLFLLLSRKGSTTLQHFIIQFIGVHLLVGTFSHTMGYLFSSSVFVDGEERHSDTATIAQHLIGGHLIWACIIAALAVLILYFSLRRAYLK